MQQDRDDKRSHAYQAKMHAIGAMPENQKNLFLTTHNKSRANDFN